MLSTPFFLLRGEPGTRPYKPETIRANANVGGENMAARLTFTRLNPCGFPIYKRISAGETAAKGGLIALPFLIFTGGFRLARRTYTLEHQVVAGNLIARHLFGAGIERRMRGIERIDHGAARRAHHVAMIGNVEVVMVACGGLNRQDLAAFRQQVQVSIHRAQANVLVLRVNALVNLVRRRMVPKRANRLQNKLSLTSVAATCHVSPCFPILPA